jgi:hypothetical protein
LGTGEQHIRIHASIDQILKRVPTLSGVLQHLRTFRSIDAALLQVGDIVTPLLVQYRSAILPQSS